MQNKKLLSVCLALFLLCTCIVGMLSVSANAVTAVTWKVTGTNDPSANEYATLQEAIEAAEAKTDWAATDALTINVAVSAAQTVEVEDELIFGAHTIFKADGSRLPIAVDGGTLALPSGYTGNVVCANSYTFRDMTFPLADSDVDFYAGSGEVELDNVKLSAAASPTKSNNAKGYFYADCPTAEAFVGWTAPANGELIETSLHLKNIDYEWGQAQKPGGNVGGIGATSGFAGTVTPEMLSVELIVTDSVIAEVYLRDDAALSPVAALTFTVNDTSADHRSNTVIGRISGVGPCYSDSTACNFGNFEYTVNINGGTFKWLSCLIRGAAFTGDYKANITEGHFLSEFQAAYAGGGYINGDSVLNISGGKFDSIYTFGVNTSADGYQNINNISGGTFEKFQGNRVAGDITTNISGTANIKVYTGCYDTTGGGGDYRVVTNMTGGTIGTYYGTGGTTLSDGTSYTVHSVVNNMMGGQITGDFYGAGCAKLNSYTENNLAGTEILGNFYATKVRKDDKSIQFRVAVTNLSASVVHGSFYGCYATLGSSSTAVTDADGTYNVKTKITGGVIGGEFRGCSDNTVTGRVINIVTAGTFEGDFYGLASNASGGVINRISGGTFKEIFGGTKGSSSNTSKSVTNEITGGTFQGDFYGTGGATPNVSTTFDGGTVNGNYYGSNSAAAGNVTNVINDGSFAKSFYGTGGKVTGNVTNTFAGGTIAGEIRGTKGETAGNVTNNLNGGSYCTSTTRYFFYGTGGLTKGNVTNNIEGTFQTKSGHKSGSNSYLTGGKTEGTITNHFRSADFTAVVYANDGDFTTINNYFYDGFTTSAQIFGAAGGSTAVSSSYVGGTINNYFYDGCNLSTFFAADGKNDRVINIAKVVNNVYDGATIKNFYGSARRGAIYDVTTNVYGGTITNFYGGTELSLLTSGNKAPDVHDTTIENNVMGGTISKFYGGNEKDNRNYTRDSIVNNVSGGTITTFYGGTESATETDLEIVNNVSGGVITTFYGSGPATVLGDENNTSSDYYPLKNVITGGIIGGVVTDGQLTATNTALAFNGNYGNVNGPVYDELKNATIGGWFTGFGTDKVSSTLMGDCVIRISDSYLAVFRGNRGATIKGSLSTYFYDSVCDGAFWATHAAISKLDGVGGTAYTEIVGSDLYGSLTAQGTGGTAAGSRVVIRDNTTSGKQTNFHNLSFNVVTSGATLPTAAAPVTIDINGGTFYGSFACRSGSNTVPFDEVPANVSINLSGKVRVGSQASLNVSTATDLTLSQVEYWTTDHVFLVIPEAFENEITTTNETSDVDGITILDKESRPGYLIYTGYAMQSGTVLTSMALTDRMVLKVWFPKDIVDSFIEGVGLPFEYRAVLDPNGLNELLGSGSITRPRKADISFTSQGKTTEYYVITLSGIGGGSFDKTITVSGSGFSFDTTVMSLADIGATSYAGTEYEPLFQAIYDYGAAACDLETKFDNKLIPVTDGVEEHEIALGSTSDIRFTSIDALMGDAVGLRLVGTPADGFDLSKLSVKLDGTVLTAGTHYSAYVSGGEVYVDLFFTADFMSTDFELSVSYNGTEAISVNTSVERTVAEIVRAYPRNEKALALLAYIQVVKNYLA